MSCTADLRTRRRVKRLSARRNRSNLIRAATMNRTTGLGLAVASGIVIAGAVAVVAMGGSGLSEAIKCDASDCRIDVKVDRRLPILPCRASVTRQASVTDAVKTITWTIGSPDYMFKGPNGVRILNDGADFELISSASGQQYKLRFLGTGKRRAYDYEFNIASVGDGESCRSPREEGPTPTLPRIKNE